MVDIKKLDDLYVCDSESEDHTWYLLPVDEDGIVRCDCPGFLNHGKCKHADAVVALDD